MSVVIVSQGMGVGEGTQRERKDVHSNALIQGQKKKKKKQPLGSHGTSQLTQGTPAVCRRRVNLRAGGECI